MQKHLGPYPIVEVTPSNVDLRITNNFQKVHKNRLKAFRGRQDKTIVKEQNVKARADTAVTNVSDKPSTADVIAIRAGSPGEDATSAPADPTLLPPQVTRYNIRTRK